jgi:Lysyl oxidase
MDARRAILALSLFALGAFGAPAAASAADRLPDLGMARLSDIKTDSGAGGSRLLRYTTTIVNVGTGPFEVRAQRALTSDMEMTVGQRIYNDLGGWRDVPTTATAHFGGDGHLHWHLRDLEHSELTRLDNGVKVGTSTKHGFCFWDLVKYRLALPGAPGSAVYDRAGCGGPSSLAVSMGLSVGWGDAYPSSLPDQNIDITGLGPGRYQLSVTADAGGWFAESNEFNNFTWVDLQIKSKGQPRVLGYGPAA